ncbi:MAG: hypothetical protein D6731_07750 [Planctomycetota bacterium]|nr:MAG: hypothetical protein D6731_07750 [Planctomycetota bacterium]
MSRKKKQDPWKTPHGRWVLRKRRLALGLYLLFLAAALVGSQGPWWRVTARGQPVTDGPKMGNDVGRFSFEPSDDPARPTVRREHLLRPAVVAALACVVAFFFASYDLVADADYQLPILLATLVLCGVGAKVFYDVWYDQRVIKDFVLVFEARRLGPALERPGNVAAVDSANPTAPPAQDGELPPSATLALEFEWGLALFLSSSLVLFLDSLYLTFFAERRLAEVS